MLYVPASIASRICCNGAVRLASSPAPYLSEYAVDEFICSDKDYIKHVISMLRLLEQIETKNDILTAFKAVNSGSGDSGDNDSDNDGHRQQCVVRRKAFVP